MKNKYTLYVLMGGTLWGFMGYFVKRLGEAGIDPTGAVMLRCGVAAVCFGITLFIRDPRLFLVKAKDIWCFLGSGILSLLAFTYCYFTSMKYIDLSTAAILLYTAPPIVMIISRFTFGEKFTGAGVAAVIMAFAGCCLVGGLGGRDAVPLAGLLLGLGSGLGYALFSIFARCAMNRGYASFTVNFYSCLLAAAGAMLIWGPADTFSLAFSSLDTGLLSVTMGVITCFLPYLLYTMGLSGLETGRAAIMASVEPVVATLVGVFIFSQPLSFMSACGIALVLGAIVVLNIKKKTV